jgi:hypothetical protein
MRRTVIAVALLALSLAPGLPSGSVAHATSLTCSGLSHVHWRDRMDPSRARCAITTEDGDVTLLLTDRDVALQLSERTFSKVRRELRDAEDDQDNWLASIIVTTVTATVREVLDRSFVYHVRDLRDVTYEDGHLVFVSRRGHVVFGDGGCCDSDVTGAFSERDALKFVREFQKLKAAQ